MTLPALTPIEAVAPAPPTTPAARPASTDHAGIGALRAAITLLVVAHHAALIYHPFAPPPLDALSTAPYWQAFPVVDPDRWPGALWFVGWNDTFFMSLMFLISGLFVWPALRARGAAGYLAGRARRLGVPFAIAAALLAPLAYWPSYLQTASHAGFWHDWLALETWPAGPAWFLWLLLAFDAAAALLTKLAPGWGDALGRAWAIPARRPVAAFAVVVTASALAYVPMALAFTPMRWSAWGPFAFQTSRIAHYAVYFATGAAIGAAGIERGLVADRGSLARRWPAWLALGAAAFLGAMTASSRDFAAGGAWPWPQVDALGFVGACASISFAMIALFARWAPRVRVVARLRRHAYAIYVVHYALVSWLGYALVRAALPGAVKAALVTAGAIMMAWALAAGLARMRRAAPTG